LYVRGLGLNDVPNVTASVTRAVSMACVAPSIPPQLGATVTVMVGVMTACGPRHLPSPKALQSVMLVGMGHTLIASYNGSVGAIAVVVWSMANITPAAVTEESPHPHRALPSIMVTGAVVVTHLGPCIIWGHVVFWGHIHIWGHHARITKVSGKVRMGVLSPRIICAYYQPHTKSHKSHKGQNPHGLD
jgi:hypothetical protein